MYFSIDLSLERNCSRHRVVCTEISSTGGTKPRLALGGASQAKKKTMSKANTGYYAAATNPATPAWLSGHCWSWC